MTRDNRNRCIAYPCTGLLLTVLLSVGYFKPEGEPDLGTLINGADILAKVGAHDKAIQECEKVLERDPGNLQAHLILAFSHDRVGRYDEALDYYAKSLDFCSDDDQRFELELTIADLHRRHGKPQTAIVDTQRVEDTFGCTHRTRLVRALSLEDAGDFDGATALLREAIADQPEDATARFHLARVLLEAGLYAPAADSLRELIASHGNRHDAWYWLACAEAWLGNDEAMYEALEQAKNFSLGTTRKQVLGEYAFSEVIETPRFQMYLRDLYANQDSASS